MAITSQIIYKGDLRTEATHLFSGTIIETDAPLDNQGLAQRFSPTDLVATGLGNCMLTIMGIAARTHNININGTTMDVEKVMASEPRRIGAINIAFYFIEGSTFSEKEKTILENAARNCPVMHSLSADCEKNIKFNWLLASE
jgi:putative redox protein